MTNCHILRKVIILQSHLIRGEKEKQQLFYFWYTFLSKNQPEGHVMVSEAEQKAFEQKYGLS